MQRISISYLLIFAIALLSLLSIAGIYWNTQRIQAEIDDAEWQSLTARLSANLMRLSSIAAMERGMTTMVLSDQASNKGLVDELKRLRILHDEYYTLVTGQQAHIQELRPGHPAIFTFGPVQDQYQVVMRLRQHADATHSGATPPLSPAHWIEQLTIYIKTLDSFHQSLSASTVPSHEHIGQYFLLRELLGTLIEHLGRDRALIAAVIAQNRPLSGEERETLVHNRAIAAESIKKLVNRLGDATYDPKVATATQTLQLELASNYLPLRESIIAVTGPATAYPLSASDWFRAASRAVDSAIAVADTLTAHVDHDVAQLREGAEQTSWSLALMIAFVILTFIYVVYVIIRRVLRPLRLLQGSAQLITTGDLSTPIGFHSLDELGALSDSMEMMRQALLTDRSVREQTEIELRKLTKTIEQSVSSVVITDINGVVEYVNPQYCRSSGYDSSEILGRPYPLLRPYGLQAAVATAIWSAISRGQVWEGEIDNQTKAGKPYQELAIITPVRNEYDVVTHLVIIQHDITQNRELESLLEHISSHDQLTGLPNRALLGQRFEQAAQSCSNGGGFALVVINLRRFAAINENLGHAVGDYVLKQCARRISAILDPADTVARFGADEFVILLRSATDPKRITQEVQRITNQINTPLVLDGHTLNINVAAGVSTYPQDGIDLDALIARAESAVALAKENPGTPIRFYTDALNVAASRRFRIETDIKSALKSKAFSLHYQPKVALTSGAAVGAEALARWEHAELGPISPVEFIAVAESTGDIIELGEWVLDEACRTLREWHRSHPTLTMSVNVSALQLCTDEFVDRVAATLERHTLPAECLELEITESCVLDQPELTMQRLRQLKQLGVKLAVDDFGTGYSSLSQLMSYPFDTLKVDRAFVRDITTSPENAGLTRLIIALGRHLRLAVVAEGAETEAHACFLRQLGCDMLQGYYFSRPLPADDAFGRIAGSRLDFPDCQSKHGSRTLLIVDDEENILRALQRVLHKEDYRVLTTTDPQEAFDLLAVHRPAVVLVDQRMPKINGVEFLQRVKELHPDIVRLILSGYTDLDTVTQAVNTGYIYKFLTKPWDDGELRTAIRESFQAAEQKAEQTTLTMQT